MAPKEANHMIAHTALHSAALLDRRHTIMLVWQ